MVARRCSQWIVIVGLCIIWYLISSVNNVVGKTVLNQFPYPVTLTMVQLLSIAIYSTPILKYYIKGHVEVPASIFKKIVLPLAVGKFLSSVSAHISIWKVPVSYSHTVKATMPLFTVIFCRLIFKEKQSTTVYTSLVPIIGGVILASLTEIHFDMIGLVAALISTAGFSLQNIFSKKVLKRTGIHQFQLLATLGRISLCMFLPVWLIVDCRRLIATHPEMHDPFTVLLLLLLDGFLSFCQNIIAFSILQIVTPLTYAVANSTKRIAVIGVSILLLRNPVSKLNVVGILLAVFGVFLYNRAKYIEGKKSKLPTTIKNDSNFNHLTSINAV